MRKPLYKILLVEDNPGDVLLVEESLRAEHVQYEMVHRETVDAAVQIVTGYRLNDPAVPHLLLMDYNLPGGDARKVIEAANANPALAGTRRAVITSSMSPRDREDALQSGAECFIYKPADLDLFLTEVGSALVKLLSEACSPGDRAEANATSLVADDQAHQPLDG
jgi:CheY-like chemotaxis protein